MRAYPTSHERQDRLAHRPVTTPAIRTNARRHTRKKRSRTPLCGICGFKFSLRLILVFLGAQLLHINCVLLGKALKHGRLVKLLAGTKFLYDAGFLEFSLEFLESALYVFALFHGYYNHCFGFILLLLICYTVAKRKIRHYFHNQQIFSFFFIPRPSFPPFIAPTTGAGRAFLQAGKRQKSTQTSLAAQVTIERTASAAP